MRIVAIVGPSGVGKTSIVKAVSERDPQFYLPVSHTTRKPKRGEQDGINYHFVSVPTFKLMKATRAFVENAKVHGNYYGTSKKELQKAEELGKDALLDVDRWGAHQIRMLYPGSATLIFILPPDISTLRMRIKERNRGDTQAEVELRIRNAVEEIRQAGMFDYWIQNIEFERTVGDILDLVGAIRRPERADHARFRNEEILKSAQKNAFSLV